MAFNQTPTPVSTFKSQASEDSGSTNQETDFSVDETTDLQFPEDTQDNQSQLDSAPEQPTEVPNLDFSLDDEEDDFSLDFETPEKPQAEQSDAGQDSLDMDMDFSFEDDDEELTLDLDEPGSPKTSPVDSGQGTLDSNAPEEPITGQFDVEENTLNSDMDFSFEDDDEELTLDLDESVIAASETATQQNEDSETEDLDFEIDLELTEHDDKGSVDDLRATEDITATVSFDTEKLSGDDAEAFGAEAKDESKRSIITEELEESVSALLDSIQVNEPAAKDSGEQKDENTIEFEVLDLDLDLDK